MSSEEDKVKHSRRQLQKKSYIRRQVKIAKAYHIDVKNPHRFQKHSAVNCDKSECSMCGNPRKLWKQKTIQEKRFEQKEFIE
jgi:hypothetical protein